jgi:hypothetical protein
MNTNKKSFNASEIVRNGQFTAEEARKLVVGGYDAVNINRDGQPSVITKDGGKIMVWDYPRNMWQRGEIVYRCLSVGLKMVGAGAPKQPDAPAPVVTPVAAVAAPAVKFEEVKPEETKAKKAKAPKKGAKPRKVKAEAPKAEGPKPEDELNALFDYFESNKVPPEPDFGSDIPGVTINW